MIAERRADLVAWAADEGHFHVTPRGTVLITPEMLGQELREAG